MRASALLRGAALGAVVAGVAAPVLRRRLELRPPLVSALAWQAPLSLALAVPRSRARDAAVYALQMWAYVAHYEMPNDDPLALRERLYVRYPIVADRAIGLGEAPTTRLQRALWREDEIRSHDVALSVTHWLWYFVPHAAVAYVLIRRPNRFPRAAGLVAATFDVGLVGYWALPTAPPWWAGANGHLPPVRRIVVDVGERAFGPVWSRIYDSLSGNPFAAMPSLHFASSVAAARALAEVGGGPERLGWAYAGTLGFALVYLGEHYVIDLVAGFALVELVRRLVRTPLFSALETVLTTAPLAPTRR